MQVMAFELAGRTFVLKLEEIEKILRHSDPLPEGPRRGDLVVILGLRGAPLPDDPQQGHRALLSGSRGVLRVGLPLGTADVNAEWILPLPGYMFDASRVPFSGILDIPERRGKGTPPRFLQRALVLDSDAIMELLTGNRR